MSRIARFAAVAAFGLAAMACGDAGDTPGNEAGVDTAGQPRLRAAPGADTAMQGAARIGVDSMDAGAYLTDGEGRALYLLEGEPTDSSTCYDACATEWPPFVAAGGTATADAPEVQGNLIGSITRRDGQRQVTYAGHALYYYHDDEGPGQATGHDVTDQWGEWYLVTPAGEHLEEGGA